MTDKQKKPTTQAERQQATFARLRAKGGKRLSVSLSKSAVEVLERLNKEFDTQNAAIEYAILNCEQRNLL